MHYIGRFAPSPTGPLHFGSLVTAVASYLEARTHHGKWLLRMEDLDKPREVAGAANQILATLEAFGFEWDGRVVYQSTRDYHYEQALSLLMDRHLVYQCTCTRKEIVDSSINVGIEGAIYPQTCLKHRIKQNHPIAWRVKTENKSLSFDDAIQGRVKQNLMLDIGDFVLKRVDGLFAYQLAVVVDDAAQGVTNIVRGADLLNSTPRQLYLQSLLGFNEPNYMHIPVATNNKGQKLSKQTLALGLNMQDTVTQLWNALSFLNQNPPEMLKGTDLNTCWEWAKRHWNFGQIPKVKNLRISTNNSV